MERVSRAEPDVGGGAGGTGLLRRLDQAQHLPQRAEGPDQAAPAGGAGSRRGRVAVRGNAGGATGARIDLAVRECRTLAGRWVRGLEPAGTGEQFQRGQPDRRARRPGQ
ncbi:MAG: hypothetical protein COC21_06790, partial [Verrucomicrobiales bacterium]